MAFHNFLMILVGLKISRLSTIRNSHKCLQEAVDEQFQHLYAQEYAWTSSRKDF